MKTLSCLPLIAVLAACSPQPAGETDANTVANSTAGSTWSRDNLPQAPACFAPEPAPLLEPGQTLLERSPAGIVRIAGRSAAGEDAWAFEIMALDDDDRARLDGAAADFFRAAGEQHDYSTDTVIYHRSRDGSFCTVVRDEATGLALLETARSLAQ